MTNGEIALLGLLAETPRYGYEIDKVIEARGMRDWTDIAFSSIYAVLRALEQKGLVTAATEVAENRVRKLFSITKTGRSALKDHIKALIEEPTAPKDPMMLVLANAGVLSGEDIEQVFAVRLTFLEEAKARLSTKLDDNLKSPVNVRRMFERSLAQIDYEIEFASMFISEVASAPAEPRNDGTTRSEDSEEREEKKEKDEKEETRTEPKPEPKPETKPEAKAEPKEPEEPKEPMGTLF